MPRIKPFYALRPNSIHQTSVVTRPLENYSLGEARLMASENPYSFLHLISPELDNPYLRGCRQELVYKKIGENLELFVDNNVLTKDGKLAMYIYRVTDGDLVQTGIWNLTHIEDYLNGAIKKHEQTLARREISLADYLQQTGLDANPVLITYIPTKVIDNLIARYCVRSPEVSFMHQDGTMHELWTVNAPNDLEVIIREFAVMSKVYLADGHHRIASMAKISKDIFFSTAYFSTSEIKILAFNRLIKDLGALNVQQFLVELQQFFIVEISKVPVNPLTPHEFGMYIGKSWYRLNAKKQLHGNDDAVSNLDVSILQNYILDPILNIKDPRTDARITFESGKTSTIELQAMVDYGNYIVAFTLFPTSVEELIEVADANGIMPPKSTCVEPKFLVGLLTNYFA